MYSAEVENQRKEGAEAGRKQKGRTRYRARKRLAEAVERGDDPPACSECGATKRVLLHHPDHLNDPHREAPGEGREVELFVLAGMRSVESTWGQSSTSRAATDRP